MAGLARSTSQNSSIGEYTESGAPTACFVALPVLILEANYAPLAEWAPEVVLGQSGAWTANVGTFLRNHATNQ